MRPANTLISTALALAATVCAATPASSSAGCPTGYGFTYPNSTDPNQQNLQFQLGQKVSIQWKSPWPAVKLAFIGEDSDTYIFIDQKESKPSYNWNVNVNNSKNDNNFYYLYIENQNDNSQHCYSSLWSITDDSSASNGASQPGSSLSSAPVTTRTPTPTQQVDVATTSGPSGIATVYTTQAIGPPGAASTSAASDASAVPSGLSDGAKAGIGVGVALGVLLLAGAAVGAFFLGKRQRKAQDDTHPPPGGPSPVINDNPPMTAGAMASRSPMASTIPSYYETGPKDSSAFVGAVPVSSAPQELDPSAIKPMTTAPPAGRQLHEMSATHEPTSHQVYELDGGDREAEERIQSKDDMS